MEEAGRIFEYLPISFRNQTEQEYIYFLWEAFTANYETEKYPFAFLAYHMLFMSFVYFEIWQIKANNPGDFEKAMVGFNKDMENELLKASTPFLLWQVKEKSVFRFLKLIGMNNSDIGQCTRIVDDRNYAVHSNGNIYFKNQGDVDRKIDDILQCIDKIQACSTRGLASCYEDFLKESSDVENREFPDAQDQIREILVYGNYMSPKDIAILKDYDIQKLEQEQNFENIQSLAKTLIEMYPEDNDNEPE